MEPGYARLCLPYLAAVVLTRGTVALADFSTEYLSNAALLALAAKISVIADANPDPAAFVPAYAIADVRDGQKLRIDMTAQLGSPQWPLSRAQQLEKAQTCLAFAGLERCHAQLAEVIGQLDDSKDAIAAIAGTGVMG